ncbi:serine/threonine protein kinase [Sorangium sp. So ce542]|uniref:serine/threonine protein kinase n=1 Tax=Sorangium sp. So ce542 TaxID=3133316 RepID=UPI003F629B21
MVREAHLAAAQVPTVRVCPTCRSDIARDAPLGLCPSCLIARVVDRGASPAEPAPSGHNDGPLPSLRLGGYEILDRIDAGGMGVVYRARQVLADGRIVALKMLQGGVFASEAAARLFQREIALVSRLDHPNIVPIYDVGEHEGRAYFTMKLMAGGTLSARLERYRDPRRAAGLVAKLARAVHEGHRLHILHRDLKPANILFDKEGEPYVADFGVAKLLGDDGGTMTGDRLGTPGYMAPEQARGQAKRVTAAADIFSLGVMLYELLTGRRPFDAPTPMQSLRRTIEEEPAAPRSVRRDLPRDLETICLTCLRKEPERRYGSAEALAEDLERWLRGEPVEARSPGPLRRALRWCARYPAAVALILAATLAFAGAVATARAQQEARRQEVLEGNVYAARTVAGAVLAQLWYYGVLVSRAAADPRAAALVEQPHLPALEELRKAYVGRDGGPSLVSWFVVDREGALLLHWPRSAAPLGNYAFRDYFQGARRIAEGPDPGVAYVSRAFRSETDHHHKFALAAPIRGASGEFAGALIAAIATDSRLGALQLSDGRRSAALAARRDRERGEPAPASDEFTVLVHDGLDHGESAGLRSAILSGLLPAAPASGAPVLDQLRLPPPDRVASLDDWHDPLAERDPAKYGGAFLAGMAPVGHTDLVVIVQSRADEAVALDADPRLRLVSWSGVALALLGLASAAASAARRRRRRLAYER